MGIYCPACQEVKDAILGLVNDDRGHEKCADCGLLLTYTDSTNKEAPIYENNRAEEE